MPRRLATLLLLSLLGLRTAPAAALLWPSEVSRIERDLAASDVEVRRRAAARLGELGERVAARLGARALEDPDVEVRLSAAAAARSLRLAGFAERVLGWLTDPDARLRLSAIELLASTAAEAPDLRAVGPLTRALSDVEPAVRAAAAAALGRSAAPEAVGGLLGRLDDSAVEVKTSAIRALSRLGDARAVVPLISKIEDPRPEVRRAVARALGEIGDARAQSPLVLLLRDADETVRVAAIGALGALGEPGATPSLSVLLGADTSTPVRRAAIDALSSIGGGEAVTALVRKLGVHPEDSDAIVAALGRMGETAAPALSSCLTTETLSERLDGCALALAAAFGRDAGPALRDAVRRGRVSPAAALTALAETGHADALLLVLEHLGHDEPLVRKSALAAAEKLLDPRRPDGRAVEPLERAFHAGRRRRAERIEILRLLGRTGSPRAVTLLGPIADRADDLELRVTALAALGSIAADGTRPVLLRALSDRESSVRLAAAFSLRKIASPANASELLDRLERAESQDRLGLSLALGGALAGADSPALVQRLERALERSRDGERDALLEALSQVPAQVGDAAKRALDRWSQRADPADRRKVAEVSGLDTGGRERLVRLATDSDPAVRANALWALGAVGTAAELPLVERAFADRDLSAAANAVTAYGRLGKRAGVDVREALCRALQARRPALRASALSAARYAGVRCADARERRLLADDASAAVRRAAALLMRDVASTADDQRALRRCTAEEPDGATALACGPAQGRPQARNSGPAEGRPRAAGGSIDPDSASAGAARALVFVVPVGEASATPLAPFALVRPDGLVRHGIADRRGAIFEVGLPDGTLELAVPAVFDD
jgi:HEAT repeat protein